MFSLYQTALWLQLKYLYYVRLSAFAFGIFWSKRNANTITIVSGPRNMGAKLQQQDSYNEATVYSLTPGLCSPARNYFSEVCM